MNKIKKKHIDKFYKYCHKFFGGDTSYLEHLTPISKSIESSTKKDWLIWDNLLTSLTRLNVDLDTIYKIFGILGYEVVDE